MKRPWHTGPAALISLSVVAVCVHALLNTLLPHAGFAISYAFWSSWSLMAAISCTWRSFHCPPTVRTHWRLAAISVSCIFVAAAVEAPAEIFFRATPTMASIGDFFFFSAFVPILLAIALPEEGVFVRSTFLLDCVQAAACSYLAYAALFNALPFVPSPAQAMPYAPLELVYNFEYLAIMLLAALRFFFGSQAPSEYSFFRSILIYTSLYAITSGIYNHFVGKYNLTNGVDALNDIPSAALALSAIFMSSAAPRSSADRRSTLIRLIDNARPVFLSLSVIALSAIIARQHFAVAIGFIFGVFILYGLRAAMLQNRIQRANVALEHVSNRLAEIALLDGLTGIANRRSFDQRLLMEWERANRSRTPLSLLLIDVDHFKRVNDAYGHIVGDECLKHTAQILRATLGHPADLIARYGGEEFAILLPETDAYGAFTVASNLRAAIAKEAAPSAGSLCPITASIGVSTWYAEEAAHPDYSSASNPGPNPDQLIRAADSALYQAKQNGRNRVEFLKIQPTHVN